LDNTAIYISIEDRWSPAYDKGATYRDKNGETVFIDEGFSLCITPGKSTISEGLVVKDSNQNEWVWIQVPTSIFVSAKSSEDYENIEKDMREYVKEHEREGFVDEWYDGIGMTKVQYDELKEKMLKSVYSNRGFWISRYEIGANTKRASSSGVTDIPVSQKNMYVYNYVTIPQSQNLASQMSSNKTGSLLFGIQWDLTLKYIEDKGGKTKNELNTDSTTWGNYFNATFNVTNGKYSEDMGFTYNEISTTYKKPALGSFGSVILTTGATKRNSALNIYDLAGNIWENTLEKRYHNQQDVGIFRGGHYDGYGDGYRVNSYFNNGPVLNVRHNDTGFRVTLF